MWKALYEWTSQFPVQLGLIFALMVVLYFIKEGELLPRPIKIWCLFRWIGCKEKRDE